MILEAAATAFAERGFTGTSTASIARAADCSEAVLYRHYASKLDLLRAVFSAASAELREGVAGLAAAVPDPLERLRALAGRIAGTAEGRRMVRLLVLTIAEAEDPDVSDALLESFAAVREMLTGVIDEGQRAGVIRGDLDSGDLAWFWQGLIVAGGIRLSVSDDEIRASLDSATDALVALSASSR